MHPTIWKASGHVDAFNDPLIDNRDSKKRYRADVLIEDQIAKYDEKIEKEIAKAKKRFGDAFDEQKYRETSPRVLEEQKKASEEIRRKESEIATWKGRLELEKSDAQRREQDMRQNYELQLKQMREVVEQYKDFKARLSTKMLGESLEMHCSNLYNSNIRSILPSAYFEKDNDASGGSKGDFIFRDYDGDFEYISIMFEMKNEMDTTATKHRNEDFFKKLEKMVQMINDDAHTVLQAACTNLNSLSRQLGELLADAKKPSSEIISNLKVLMMSSRNRDNTNFLEANYEKWNIFFEIMKNYVIINSGDLKHE
jgi:hypothetical protein